MAEESDNLQDLLFIAITLRKVMQMVLHIGVMFASEIGTGESGEIVEEWRQIDRCPFCYLIMQIESGSLFLHILYL